MKNNKKRRPCTALAMTAALMIGLLFTGCGQKNIADTGSSTEQTSIDEYQISTDGAKPAGKKSEVVTVKADSSGSVKSISDEITLSELSDGINVMETTDLSDLKNTVGDEDFVILTDGTVIFENKGSDITYKGNASADIPVSVKVTYYLDGVETSPKKMAGASGEIKIRFDYENKTKETIDVNGETITTPIPFLAVSATTLDKKIFSDIKVTNGKVVNLSGRQMAIGYALPGLSDTLSLNSYEMFENSKEIPEYVEITAHAENFSLEFTETIITNSVFSSLDDDAFDDEDNLSDSVNKLSDASADVLDGISELNSGLTEFSGHLTPSV